jgi:hypothetical protein
LCSVPERLVSDLRHANRVGGWAGTGVCKGFFLGVEHVILMVRGVYILSIPARWEVMYLRVISEYIGSFR